jgi:transposase-like protein
VIIDGAPGLEVSVVALWSNDLPIQRCAVDKHSNLLAHAPKHMHEQLSYDYRDMTYAETAADAKKYRLIRPKSNRSKDAAGEFLPLSRHHRRLPMSRVLLGGSG